MTLLENMMAQTLRSVETYLVERNIETTGVVGRTIILPQIRSTLAAYDAALDQEAADRFGVYC
jgi:hypothetical protein